MDVNNTDKQAAEPTKQKKTFAGTLMSTLGSLITAAAVIVLVCNFIFPVFKITGSSMNPTLSKGQVVLCNKSADIKKGDVIAFYHNKKVLIKRVIGTPEDVVNILEDGTVELNGNKLDEPYISCKNLGECDTAFPFTVPDSRYFVMGDERASSLDSRSSSVGCIAEENIIGKVYMKVLPFSSFGKVK